MKNIPHNRLYDINDGNVREDGDFIVYWMIASRRLSYNFGLQRARYWASRLNKPLVVFEALRCDYPWASDRIHKFIIDGMALHAEKLQSTPILYYPYLEPEHGHGKGLIEQLSKHACLIVTDHFPCFFLPQMLKKAGQVSRVKLEAVDSNGLVPIREQGKAFSTAYQFRRYLQKNLMQHINDFPLAYPLKNLEIPEMKSLPKEIHTKWPPVSQQILENPRKFFSSLPIDHKVEILDLKGGGEQAHQNLKRFLEQDVKKYADERNKPQKQATSQLSPYLHFGHISPHKIFEYLMKQENWSPEKVSQKNDGRREGWWNCSVGAEAFLDQFITWRELGYGFCEFIPNYDQFDSLPDWARETLIEHQKDERPYTYDLEQFENADTHDPLWNAAQNQLRREGQIHNYLRMLWGKKILHWTASPEEALAIMIELNNKYALDGRNPNSYSGIFWCLGRFDRAWGPERKIFGKVRYMTSESTARKHKVDGYIQKFSP